MNNTRKEEKTPLMGNCTKCGIYYNKRSGGLIDGNMVCIECYEKYKSMNTRKKIEIINSTMDTLHKDMFGTAICDLANKLNELITAHNSTIEEESITQSHTVTGKPVASNPSQETKEELHNIGMGFVCPCEKCADIIRKQTLKIQKEYEMPETKEIVQDNRIFDTNNREFLKGNYSSETKESFLDGWTTDVVCNDKGITYIKQSAIEDYIRSERKAVVEEAKEKIAVKSRIREVEPTGSQDIGFNTGYDKKTREVLDILNSLNQ